MSIKDKITPQLKEAFLEELKKSIDSGKEHGFPICINQQSKLFAPKKRCQGDECGIVMENIHQYCHGKVQGSFHTHTFLPKTERFYGRMATEKEIKSVTNMYRRNFARKGVTLQSPSHHDLVDSLIDQCIGETEGTVCTGTDLEIDKVECWTAIEEKVKIKDCTKATKEHKEKISEEPRQWVKPLFDKEVIYLI